MNKFLVFGLMGGAGFLIAAAVIKKKKALPREIRALDLAPETAQLFQQQLKDAGVKMASVKQTVGLRTYYPVKGDRATALIRRFGENPDTPIVYTKWQSVNPQNAGLLALPGQIIKIPPGLIDGGPIAQATGEVK